jgi:hypothetical protein
MDDDEEDGGCDELLLGMQYLQTPGHDVLPHVPRVTIVALLPHETFTCRHCPPLLLAVHPPDRAKIDDDDPPVTCAVSVCDDV